MEVAIIQETCCHEHCGIIFWITREQYDRLQSSKRSFFCPNGHSQSYTGENDKVKAIRLQNEKNALEREKNAEIARLQRDLKKKCRKPKVAK